MFTFRCIAARSRQVVRLICILAITAVATNAATWSNVTVTTTDGWEYPDMTVVTTAGEPAILLVNGQGGRKSMPRAAIRTIVDPAGRDVTEEVFAGEESDHRGFIRPPASMPEPEAIDPERNVVITRRRRERRAGSALPARVLVLPSLSIGASGTAGDAFRGLQSGGSLGFGLRITALKDAYIGFDYRRQWLDFDSFTSSYYGGFRNDFYLDELYFVVGTHPRAVWLDRPITFVEVGVGAVFQNSGSYFALDTNGAYFPRFFDDTKLGVLFAGGVLLPLSHSVPGVALHLGADLRLTGADGTYGNRAGILYGLNAGFTFLLGDSQ